MTIGATRHGRRRAIALGAAAIALCALMALAFWKALIDSPSSMTRRSDAGVVVRSTEDRERYAGSQTCAECHEEIWRRYQSHPMARSLATPKPGADGFADDPPIHGHVSAPPRVFSPPGENRWRYWVEPTADGQRHHEIGLDSEGNAIYDQHYPVDFIIGSGQRGRSYLIDRDGYLFLSPIAWYSHGQCWDLAPGYEPGRHKRFEREAAERCLLCHSGRLNEAVLDGNESLRYEAPPFLEMGISCERCHGPGADHVRARRAGQAIAGDIVQPTSLDPARRDAVCAQCHLQGAHQVLHAGKWHADFQPGDLLCDVWTTFVEGAGGQPRDASTLAVSQVEQMVLSRCYTASQGKLGCVSCHDPHQMPPAAPDKRGAYFRARCLTCHDVADCDAPSSDRDRQADRCAQCHMPALAASDVPHTSQTNHRLPRDPSSSAAVANAAPSELQVFAFWSEQPEAEQVQRARALVWTRQAEVLRDPTLAARARLVLNNVVRDNPRDWNAVDALALCLAMLGQPDAALERWRELLEHSPGHRLALQSVASLKLTRGDHVGAAGALGALLEQYPIPAGGSHQYSRVLADLGRQDEAFQWARQATEADPSKPQYWRWLAELADRSGRREQGRLASEMAEQLEFNGQH